MAEFLQSWGYIGVFLGIVLTGVPLVPMPEELPVVLGGALAGSDAASWWIMLPLCILAVVIGDGLLYTIGRLFGPHLLQYGWVKRRLLPPDRLERIEDNFRKHGIKILFIARLTPGIRSPIFFTAGLTRMSAARFFLADAIYAIPGVTLLFFLGYWFSGSMVSLINNEMAQIKHVMILVVILGVAGYVLYRFLRRPVVTGDPKDIPPLAAKITHTIKQWTFARGGVGHGKKKSDIPKSNSESLTVSLFRGKAAPRSEKRAKPLPRLPC
ncbi:MAG: DedA family protein [Gemmataceae bacterium]|nr:DedA family protein [Gemmataceae bacterium]MCI0740460.1 DedA family protein [Gemmataceae bacterium]